MGYASRLCFVDSCQNFAEGGAPRMQRLQYFVLFRLLHKVSVDPGCHSDPMDRDCQEHRVRLIYNLPINMVEDKGSIRDAGLSLRIRPATIADRERLIPLINSAFSVETFLQGPRTDEVRLAAAMEKGAILMAEDDTGRLVASVYTELRTERGYVGLLAVDPAHQRSGLGQRMMTAAEEHLRSHGCQAVDITVLSLRPELLPLYRKFGFIETGTEEFVYPHPIKDGQACHCIVMSKRL